MRTEVEVAEDEKQFAQIKIPTSQRVLYEKQGYEFVSNCDFMGNIAITCFVRKRIKDET